MKQFAIYEGNMDSLLKKVTRIRNKCNKYGCDFHFAEVGEEFRTLEDENGKEYIAKFILVEAEGVAKVNGWKFVASIEHTEKGNILNKACEMELPDRFYTTDPVCEHCNSSRSRKDTFIVWNEETGEFKQVGKSCLKDFTGGMSAEGVAQYTSLFEELIKGETPSVGYGEIYYPVKEYLMYVAETVKYFGYVPTTSYEESTRRRALHYYDMEHGGKFSEADEKRIKEEMQRVSFNAQSNADVVENMLGWLDEQNTENNYFHNLKTACSLEYTAFRNLGILASLFPTYNRNLIREAEAKKKAEEDILSDYVGTIGDRVEVEVKSFQCVTSWETDYGITRIYTFTDDAGNIYTWKTSNFVDEESANKIKGTIKAHKEYRGVKQTELTRCRVA